MLRRNEKILKLDFKKLKVFVDTDLRTYPTSSTGQ